MTTAALTAAAAADAVVIMPIGSIEQHGPHLPTGTDSMCAASLVADVLQRLSPDTPAVALPPLWYGYSDDHHGFGGTISLPFRVLEDVLANVGKEVLTNGFKRLVFVNGHGSNDRLMYYVVRRIREEASAPHCAVGVTYWKVATQQLQTQRRSPYGGMGHAGELETSLMLHYAAHTVDHDKAVTEMPERYSPYRGGDLLDSGMVVVAERFIDRTRSGVVGDPSPATKEAGESFAEAITQRLSELIADVTTWPLIGGDDIEMGTE
jgi:creatinine amidohydrolase